MKYVNISRRVYVDKFRLFFIILIGGFLSTCREYPLGMGMGKEVRKTGLDVLAKVPWGTHLCQLYNTIGDSLEVLGPFFKEGLVNNELCLWIYSQNSTYRDVVETIRNHVADVDEYLEKGQLIILPYTQWYIDDEGFDGQKVLDKWQEIYTSAAEKGYDGIRAVGDAGWLERHYYDSVFDYEAKIDAEMKKNPMIAICLYSLPTLDTLGFAEIIKKHEYVMLWDEGKHKLLKNMELEDRKWQLLTVRRECKRLEGLLYNTLKRDKMRTEFLAGISHELRTPLNVIMTALQLLTGNRESVNTCSDIRDRCYGMIRNNCLRLLRLTNNIIDLAKIENNSFGLSLRYCNIVEVVENITLSATGYMENRGINLCFDTDTEEKMVSCDPEQIERIVLNLLSNAVKYTRYKGEVWVSVIDTGDDVEIIVRDNGMGIPLSKQKHIFDRFSRAENLSTRQQEGSGIGLFIAKSIAEKHGGKIGVKSEVGRGSEFTVRIPAGLPPEPVGAHYTSISFNYEEQVEIEFSDIRA